jgi:hypothetical protein
LIEEFAAPYYELADRVIIDIASPLGGQPQLTLKVQIHLRLLKTQKDLTKILQAKLSKTQTS